MELTTTTLLATVASVLLLFVTGGVVYLSVIEWRDRRRRQNSEVPVKTKSRR